MASFSHAQQSHTSLKIVQEDSRSCRACAQTNVGYEASFLTAITSASTQKWGPKSDDASRAASANGLRWLFLQVRVPMWNYVQSACGGVIAWHSISITELVKGSE